MEEKVRSYIERFHMIRQGDVVAAGVSGGADSVCLLLLLEKLRREIGFSLTVIHVEHGIRGGESLRDAGFTRRLCEELDVPFELCRVDVPSFREESGMSVEEAARELRYKCFLEVCGRIGADSIALAQHAEDCAETMLFNIARGTGIRGMGGIRPVSERSTGSGMEGDPGGIKVIRPLLCVKRDEIEEWLAGRQQEYCTDSTNADEAYARNRIRERVLPELTKVNAQAVSHMQSLAGQMAEICGYLDEAAWEAGRGSFSVVTGSGADKEAADGEGAAVVVVSCAEFSAMHPVLQKHLLPRLIGLAAGSMKDITAFHVEQVMDLIRAGAGTKASLPHRVTAERTYDTVVLRAGRREQEGGEGDIPREMMLEIPGITMTEDGFVFSAEVIPAPFSKKIPQKSYTKWFDYDKMNSAVWLRTRHPGDFLQTDADGGHKKLKKFFIDEKVPASLRDGIWLLADGDHIVWVVGYRISEAYKVTGQTRNILCVSVSVPGGDESPGGIE